MSTSSPARPDLPAGGALGTFTGVFTPSLLTILGIILFLRLGFVVGNAGLTGALVIIGIATGISVLTSISLAAIATNMEVKGGGDYYLISRTLGLEFGGAIGIVLFLAQSVSIGFYAIGFGEALSSVLDLSASSAPQLVAGVAVVLLFGLAWAGADVASKFQSGIFVLLVLALISFFAGAIGEADASTLRAGTSAPPFGLGFWAVFAIFFPAVTGFTQGVSMSGDLRDPGKSLPKGTFSAVGVSTVVYVAVAVLLAAGASSMTLVNDTTTMSRLAAVPVLIDIGVVAATLSSAMASFLGAPRIMQSLASDRIFPVLTPLQMGVGPTSNPRRAVLVSFLIALTTIGAGNLNAIAPVVSMFFLISYGLLNYATYYEARAASPSFRPRFRFFDRRVSLVGATGCLAAMLLISPIAGIFALAVLGAIYLYLRSRPNDSRWADAAGAHYFQRTKEALRSLTNQDQHARNWRPQVLTFSADPVRRVRLLTVSSWLEGGSGLAAAVTIVQGQGVRARRDCAQRQLELEQQIASLGLDVHARAVLAPDGLNALPLIVQSFGIGQVRANTVLFGWQETPGEERRSNYVAVLRDVTRLGVNAVTVSTDEPRWERLEAIPRGDRRIDVWWTDDDAGRLALLTAYLWTRTPDWSRARIRVVVQADPGEEDVVVAELAAMLDRVRIKAEVATVPSVDLTTLTTTFRDAATVFLPVRLGRTDVLDKWDRRLEPLLDQLPLSVGFISAAPIDLEAGPDSGRPASLLAAEQAIERCVARVEDAEEQVEQLRVQLRGLIAGGARKGLAEVRDTEAAFEQAKRRRAKARAKLDDARSELEELLRE